MTAVFGILERAQIQRDDSCERIFDNETIDSLNFVNAKLACLHVL